MKHGHILALAVLVCALAGSALVWLTFQRDMRALHARVSAETAAAETGFGRVEYATGGRGSPILVIHGAGGGHDQGRLLAEAFLPDGYRWIAPSRFGYLGSALPTDASTLAQAHAFAELLDLLGVERVALLAMSGGVPPALQFSLAYPERTSALVLLSLAPYAPLTAEQQELSVPLWLYDALFAADFPYWFILRLAPYKLAPMFDARPDLRAQMTAHEEGFLDAMIRAFLPVTARREGLRNEGAAIDPAAALDPAGITVPTLIAHARDDRITPFSTAEYTANRVGDNHFLALDTGGHLLLGHHDEVRTWIAEFLTAHSEGRGP